jgi:predicted amidohydrolase
METNQLKIAATQMASVPGDFLKNREIISKFVEKASLQRADIIITPELSNVGYDLTILRNIGYNFQEEAKYYGKLASDYNITLLAGLLEETDGKLFNSLFVFSPQSEITTVYRKINLFPLSKESEVFQHGTGPIAITVGDFKIGLSICYDIRFPELFRAYVEENCDALIVSSAFPFPRLEHWQTLLKAHAILNQSWVIASNRVGKDVGAPFLGHSCFIDPWGQVTSTFTDKEEDILVDTIDLARVNEVRKKICAFSDRQAYFGKVN